MNLQELNLSVIKYRATNRKPAYGYPIKYTGLNSKNYTLKFKVGDYDNRIQLLDYLYLLNTTNKNAFDLILGSNVKVFCNCADFLYKGFQYIGTLDRYGIKPEYRRPDHTNPDLEGSVCKHLLWLFQNIKKFRSQIEKDLFKNPQPNPTKIDRLIHDVMKGANASKSINKLDVSKPLNQPGLDKLIHQVMNRKLNK